MIRRCGGAGSIDLKSLEKLLSLGDNMNSSWLFFAVAFLVGALITVQTTHA
jgi:hypothetical protein